MKLPVDYYCVYSFVVFILTFFDWNKKHTAHDAVCLALLLVDESLSFHQLECTNFTRKKAANLILIVSDLQTFFVNQNRTAKKSWIFLYQIIEMLK